MKIIDQILIENFLKQNNEFVGKSKLVQYIVDENISKANIKKGCEKIKFIDSTIKDSYLEKFKIYCLIFNNQKITSSSAIRSFKGTKSVR